MVKKTIITILMMIILSSIALASTYTISGETAYIDDAKAYISATPHTMSGSGWVQVELEAKTFTGNIDFAIGVDSANAELTNFEMYKYINLGNGSKWQYVPYSLNTASYNYNGKTTWNYATNVPIIAGERYQARFYLNIIQGTSGKYDIAVKPSAQSFSTAIANGNFYLLDPWWNSTTPTEYTGITYPNYWSTLNNGSSTARIQSIYPYQNNITFSIGGEDTINDEIGRISGTNTGIVFVDGKIGKAMNITNSASVKANYSTTLSSSYINSKPFTISSWLKPNLGSGNQYEVYLSLTASGGTNASFMLNFKNQAGNVWGSYNGTTWTEWGANSSPVNNQWQLYTATYNGTYMCLYINQTLMECKAYTYTGGRNNILGINTWNTDTAYLYNGLIDEVKMHNYALNITQIQEEYNNGSGRKYQESRLQQQYPLNNKLVSYYRFENNTLDENYRNSGVSNITFSSLKQELYNSGDFDGNSLINITYNSAWNLGSNNWTFSWWQNLTDATTGRTIFGLSPTSNALTLGYNNIGVGNIYASSTGGAWDIANGISMGNISYNKSQHFIVSRNSGRILVWNNGTLVLNTTFTGSIYSTNHNPTIGLGGGGLRFKGKIDEFIFYNDTITEDEASYLYNNGIGRIFNESANMYYSIINTTASNYSGFIMNLSSIDQNTKVKVTADNGTTYTQYYNASSNNQNLTFATTGNKLGFIINLTNGNATYTTYATSFGLLNITNPFNILLSILSPLNNQLFKNYANIHHNYTVNSTGTNSTIYCNETYIGNTTQNFQTTTTNNTYELKTRTITDTLSQEINRNFSLYCYNEQTSASTNVIYRYDDLAPRLLVNYENMNTTTNNITLQHNFSDSNLTITYIQLEDKYNYTNITTGNISDSKYSNTTLWGIGTYTVNGNATDEAGNTLNFSKNFNILPISTIASFTFKDGITGINVPYTSITDEYLGITQYSNPYTNGITNYINKTNYKREINVTFVDINLENLPSTQYYNITRQTSVYNYTGTPVRLILRFYDNGTAKSINGIYSESNVSVRDTIFNITNALTLIKANMSRGKVSIRFGLNYTNTSPSDWVQTYEFINDGTTDITEDIELIQNVGNLTRTSIFGKTYTIAPTTLESLHMQILDSGTGNPITNAIIRSRQEERDTSSNISKLTNQKLSDEEGKVFIIHEPETNIKIEILSDGYVSKVITIDPDQEIYDSSSPLIIKLVKSGEGVYRNGIVLRPKYITNETVLIKLMVYAPLNSKVQYVTEKELSTNPTMLHSLELDDDKTAEIYIYNTDNCGNIASFFGLDITEAMCLARTDEFDNENTTISIYMDQTFWGNITIPIYTPSETVQETFKQEFDDLNTDYLGIIGFIALIGITITLQTRFRGRGIGVPTFMIGIIILSFISNIFMIPAAIIVIGYIGRWIYKTIGGGQ